MGSALGGGDGVQLILVGTSHRLAPIAARERFAVGEADLPRFTASLAHAAALREAVVLSTCNRFEVYAVVDSSAGRQILLDAVLHAFGAPDDARALFRAESGEPVVRHLFRVTAGLESQALGETEILGQVRRAYAAAQEARSVGKLLHALFNQALATAKRAHDETQLSRGAKSLASLAVSLLEEDLDGLGGRSVHIWGAGSTAADAAAQLREAGARVTLWNRTAARATSLAGKSGATTGPWSERAAALAEADALVCAAGAKHPLLTAEEAAPVLSGRTEPLCIVDLGLPRAIQSDVAGLPGARLRNLDELGERLRRDQGARRRAAREAEGIIDRDVEAFSIWVKSLSVVPLIRSLRAKADEIRRRELEAALRRLPELSERERAILDRMTTRIVQKLLNDPTVRLKEMAGDGHESRYAQAFTQLFGLDPERVAAEGSSAPAPERASARTGHAGAEADALRPTPHRTLQP